MGSEAVKNSFFGGPKILPLPAHILCRHTPHIEQHPASAQGIPAHILCRHTLHIKQHPASAQGIDACRELFPLPPQYIAEKHSAGGRGRVRQHPTLFPLPSGEGVRGWGKLK